MLPYTNVQQNIDIQEPPPRVLNSPGCRLTTDICGRSIFERSLGTLLPTSATLQYLTHHRCIIIIIIQIIVINSKVPYAVAARGRVVTAKGQHSFTDKKAPNLTYSHIYFKNLSQIPVSKGGPLGVELKGYWEELNVHDNCHGMTICHFRADMPRESYTSVQ